MTQTKVLIAVDPQLWRRVKAAAALAGLTLSDWLEEACRARLRQSPWTFQPRKTRRGPSSTGESQEKADHP